MFDLLDVVALLQAHPEFGLAKGQVGTVVENYGDSFEVEFCDPDGKSYATAAFPGRELLKLHHKAQAAA